MQADTDFEKFKAHCQKFEQELEKRRAAFKLWFKFGAALFLTLLVLVIAALINIKTISRFDSQGLVITVLVLSLFWSFWFGASRLAKYKSGRKFALVEGGGHNINKQYSLKQEIFSNFLSFLGDFKFKVDATIPLYDIEPSTLIPNNDQYISHDYIEGIVNKTRVKIAETQLVKILNGKPYDFFEGLFILIDFSESDIKLRAELSGQSVLIDDKKKTDSWFQKRYKHFEIFKLPTTELESKFEAYTTNKEETGRIFSEKMLNSLTGFSKFLNSLDMPVHEWDDDLLYKFESYINRASDDLWALISHIGDLVTFSSYRKSGYLDSVFDPTKLNEMSDDARAINSSIQCSAYKNKFFITIPYRRDLFEINSLFRKPVSDDERKFIFELIKLIDTVTNELVGN